MEMTATFKPKKSDLAREGYDPSATDDAIYFNDAERGAFVRMDEALYQRIQSGAMRSVITPCCRRPRSAPCR